MTPYELARQVYEREPCARAFLVDLELHFQYGFVFSTPEFFIMGRAVWSGAVHEAIVNPEIRFDCPCDCWHIYLMAGDTTKAWAIMPRPLPLFSWERRNELRFYPAESIRRLSVGAALGASP